MATPPHAGAGPAPPDGGPGDLGIVVIGRNEGERLRRCLHSLGERVRAAVYVDSGSRDGSPELARSLGAQVVELDPSLPFTAARARNEGLQALDRRPGPPVTWVQFVDGDCEVEAGWLDRALRELRASPELAVVFGRRRERERSASRYNRLCDLEWDVPPGDALSCGGDAMMRAEALRACGGYDADRIAGEEPELCLRLRAAGWRIRCLAAPMTVHDAAMRRFGQWWNRALRAGYVEAEGLAAHSWSYPRRRAALANLFWALVVPATALAAIGWALAAGRPGLAGALAVGAAVLYAASWLRTLLRARARWPVADAALWATSCLLAKAPACCGMAVYWWRRVTGGNRALIEYKRAGPR